jgi:hypothetical protein
MGQRSRVMMSFWDATPFDSLIVLAMIQIAPRLCDKSIVPGRTLRFGAVSWNALRRRLTRAAVCAAAGGSVVAIAGCGSLVAISSAIPTPAQLACTNPGPALQSESFSIAQPLSTTPDGLRYADISVGCGAQAEAGSVVTVQYTGWLESGQQFDTSRKAGRNPLTYQLGARRIIPGLELGVVGMKVGGKRRLAIPSALAFGPTGRPPLVPPNATLIMNIELVALR